MPPPLPSHSQYQVLNRNRNDQTSFWARVRSLWYRLLHLGLSDDIPFFERQKTHALNVLAIPALPSMLFFTLVNLGPRPGLALLNLGTLLCYCGVIAINATRRFLQWRGVFIFASLSLFLLEAMWYDNSMEYVVVPMMVSSLILFDKRWQYYLASAFGISAFCYLKFLQYPIYHRNPAMLHRVMSNILMSMVMLAVAMDYFRGIYIKYHQQVEGHKKLLEQQQQQLLQQKQQLEAQNKELHELSESRHRILFTLAHDLRNPLSGIEALSKRILRTEDGLETKSLLAVIDATAERSQKQIQDLLDEYQYREAGGETDRQLVNIGELIQHTLMPLQYKAAQKQVSITLLQPPFAVLARVNPMQLCRVVENLVSNAVKFSYAQSVVTVQVTMENGELVLKVADQGIGIPEDKRAFVFDGKAMIRQTGTMDEQSYGLGLSICKEIAEAHRGAVYLTPGTQQGCEFVFRIPSGEDL